MAPCLDAQSSPKVGQTAPDKRILLLDIAEHSCVRGVAKTSAKVLVYSLRVCATTPKILALRLWQVGKEEAFETHVFRIYRSRCNGWRLNFA